MFPLSESAELVPWAKFLEVIGRKCVPKVYLNYISVTYQLELVAMNAGRSQMEPTMTMMGHNKPRHRFAQPWGCKHDLEHGDGSVGAPVDVLHVIDFELYIRGHQLKCNNYSNGL